ncbi:hypothetical protein H0H81_005000 [Sphagnurus paluster]|uniref:HAT C-terminal dimerisation domain-containing protein n=1 Tax=Sphagnurus paluster TaxID=117069 RepID=A0A9P7GLR2_9AGAR|nr:hypothetical protein H0H81_005000 [Sphagnurus paluster]
MMSDFCACHPLPQATPTEHPPAHKDQMYRVAKRLDLMSMLELDTPVHKVERPETVEEEFDAYTSKISSRGTDMIQFWQVAEHQKRFSTIYKMALDYIPIQASAVPCEHVFSSASETDTKRRNRINPNLFEALQIMKFALRRDWLNFTAHLLMLEEDMVMDARDAIEGVEDIDGLQGLLATDPDLGEEAFNRALGAICVDSGDK